MNDKIKSKAEEKFQATQNRAERAVNDREMEHQKVVERTKKLRALRLARDAAEAEKSSSE